MTSHLQVAISRTQEAVISRRKRSPEEREEEQIEVEATVADCCRLALVTMRARRETERARSSTSADDKSNIGVGRPRFRMKLRPIQSYSKVPSKATLAGRAGLSPQRVLASLALASCLMICSPQSPQSSPRARVDSNQVHCWPQASFSSSGQPKSFFAQQGQTSGSSSEIHQVRGLSGAGQRIELPCLVDQASCGEVYYITWTRQSLSPQSQSSPSAASPVPGPPGHQAAGSAGGQWSRVYLYTGANDSAPHKPIGDLVSRASFVMPDKRLVALADDEERAPPLARLVIEEPKLSDEALYKCDVTYVKGKCPSISLVRVQMLALPAKAQIQVVHEQQQQPGATGGAESGAAGSRAAAAPATTTLTTTADGQLIGPYNEHGQLRLSCLVFGGRPQPKSVIWRRIDPQGRTTNLQSAQNQNHQQQPKSALQSPPAQASLIQVELNHTLSSSDLGAKFECHVEHEALEQPAARVVVVSSQQQASVGAGAAGQQEPLDQMLDLHPAQAHPQLARENSEDGEQQAVSSSPARPTRSLDAHVFVDLNVEAASLDLFMSKLNKRNSSEPLREGDLVELECVAYNSKPPANISWFNGADAIEQLEPGAAPTTAAPAAPTGGANWPKHRLRFKRLLQRNQVHQNEDGQTYNTHSFLSIKLSRHENRAQISCRAQNAPMRQPLVKSLELQVQHAPIVLMEPAAGIVVSESTAGAERQQHTQAGAESVLGAAPSGASREQQDVSFYCVFSANPSELVPNATRWFKDGRPLSGVVRAPPPAEPHDAPEPAERRLIESTTAAGYPVLTVRQVRRQDAGLYECQLANLVGPSERLPASEASRLEVNFRPAVELRLFRPPGDPKEQPAPAEQGAAVPANYPPGELRPLDLNQELCLAGSSLVLRCDVLDAQPSKIHKFHWFKQPQAQTRRRPSAPPPTATGARQQLIAVSESNQLSLGALSANFSPAAYSCSASNSLGPSEPSNTVELQLSYAPGPSFVRAVNELEQQQQQLQRRLAADSAQALLPIRPDRSEDATASAGQQDWPQQARQQQTVAAGRELLLECVTPELGQPRAHIWLWFKDGQPLESTAGSSDDNDDGDEARADLRPAKPPSASLAAPEPLIWGRDNPITTGSRDLSARSAGERAPPPTAGRRVARKAPAQPRVRLLNSGRHLLIPTLQLGHKGNYSCVAVNRLGSGPQPHREGAAASPAPGSWQLRVAMAPSFVRPLPAQTLWQESGPQQQVELVCHVQCEPVCQLEWLKNNEPLELSPGSGPPSAGNNPRAPAVGPPLVSYQVRQSILDEDPAADQFRSVESRLTLSFGPPPAARQSAGRDGSSLESDGERWKRLERRRTLSGANYSCQSSPNSMGAGARSSTKFIVQYPPENLLINAASDKLSLVEGSNGPRLGCEASGEPAPQYRWFLLKGAQASLRDRQTASRQAGAPINQLASRALESLARGASESPSASSSSQLGDSLVELSATPAAESAGAGSLLDLGATSLDRSQAGRYVCEASNGLGQASQSIHVSVLYKPTCAALHLHSLDLTERLTPSKPTEQESAPAASNRARARPLKAADSDQYSLVRETSEDFIDLRKMLVLAPLLNRYQPTTTTSSAGDEDHESLSFRGSIFQTILNDKRQQQQSTFGGAQLKDRGALIHQDDSISSNDLSVDTNSDRLVAQESSGGGTSTPSSLAGDSWAKFNGLLLKFLNNYMRQVKSLEEKASTSFEPASVGARDARSQQDAAGNKRRASHQQQPGLATLDSFDLADDQLGSSSKSSSGANSQQARTGTKNFVTFACLAKDASPMGNLSFDWSFADLNLPETRPDAHSLFDNTQHSDGADLRRQPDQQRQVELAGAKPLLVYADDDYSIQVILVRRLDTRSSLNPFQMSLVTLNVVIIDQNTTTTTTTGNQRSARQSTGSNSAGQTPARAPVIKNRYQSFYDSLSKQQSSAQTAAANGNNNIQFSAHEFVEAASDRAYNSQAPGSSLHQPMELSARNWQEQLGNLLKCSVTNQIGSSGACHVRVNLEERSKGSSSSSSSEFARWRMPSLAHKSLLIISVLVACALIVFASSALLLGPYLRAGGLVGGAGLCALGRLKRDQSGRSSGGSTKEGTESNTGQSTGSQKSSVLGLLGNGGDSSIQGSSDDDSSAGRLNNGNNNHHLSLDRNNNINGSAEQAARMQLAMNLANNYHHNKQLQLAPESSSTSTGVTSASYDEPRGLQQQQQQASLSYHTHNDQLLDGGDVCHYRDGLGAKLPGLIPVAPANKRPEAARAVVAASRDGSSKTLHGSAGSRLLAGLKFKSLSKFKVDRISDLSNFAARMENIRSLHTKNVSSSETNTTGLSLSGELPMTVASPSSSGSSRTFFGSANQRRSLGAGGLKRPNGPQLQAHQIANNIEQQHAYRQAQMQTMQQLNSQRLLAAAAAAATSNSSGSMAPTYSNMINSPTNAMDEFIRQREHNMPIEQHRTNDPSVSFYRSQSVRHPSQLVSDLHSSMYLMEAEDQHQHRFYPQHMNRGPPVYPRTHQAVPLASHYEQRFVGNPRPLVAARTSHRQQQQQILAAGAVSNSSLLQHQTSTLSNRFSMPAYNRSFGYDQPSSLGFLDTIDSHLNRLPEAVVMNHPDQSQLIAYANAIDTNTHYREPHNDVNQLQQDHQSVEHIYDVNAYATPEQTPLRRLNTTTTTTTTTTTNNGQVHSSTQATERPRVSQLIQSFNSKLPE